MGFAPVTGIVVICSFVGKILKESSLNSKWIPFICGLIGGILGVVGMFFVPNFPSTNIIDALAMGLISGLASTGAHQAVKQHMEDKGSN